MNDSQAQITWPSAQQKTPAFRPGLASSSDWAAVDYAGTFSAPLVFRSHVTPNAWSAALKAFEASLRCMVIMAYSTSSGSACLLTMPYRASAKSLALAFSAAFSPCACQGKSRLDRGASHGVVGKQRASGRLNQFAN